MTGEIPAKKDLDEDHLTDLEQRKVVTALAMTAQELKDKGHNITARQYWDLHDKVSEMIGGMDKELQPVTIEQVEEK